ncbi:MAG: hypothetical protein Q8J80_04870 [Gallionella sp.]|nr:hypothetical protein [Gallionella sp.]
MKARIIEADASGNVRCLIDGVGIRAAWIGNPQPAVGAEYDVELSVREQLVWGDNVFTNANGRIGIEPDGQGVILHVMLESFDDGVGTLRLGNSIVQVEMTGMAQLIGKAVSIKVRELGLCDTGI